ncbi:MAG: hypothetical protein HUU20_04905, partial [Pirellulales bacterium]|nr:hypothetical protein [Pirellulales bacterium]
ESDIEGAPIAFQIESLTSGTLTKDGVAVSAGGILSSGQSWVWTPSPDANGELEAFTILAWDGLTTSATAVPVRVSVAAVNDVPAFTVGANQTVSEDAGAQSVAGWATGISAGPANEADQTLSFLVSTDNDELFAARPAIDPSSGQLTYTSASNAFGMATVSVSLQDSGGTVNGGLDTVVRTFTITVDPVNDAPSFSKGADLAIDEDAGAQTVPGWATGVSTGPANEADQSLSFVLSTDNDGLFAALPQIDPASGELTYTPAADAFGTATVTVRLQDTGGTDGGGADISVDQTFTITINPVNDVPAFTKGADLVIDEDAQSQSLVGWATAISAGRPNEAGQTLTFVATTDNDALFATLPALDAAGTLTYTPANNAFGTATVTVHLEDDGGTDRAGVNASAPQTFTITVNPVNDVPAFTKGADLTVNEDAGAQSVAGWATAISTGPANEATQVPAFVVSTDNAALFAVLPQIDATGALIYTPAADAFGSAQVTVFLKDDGGTERNGVDTSAAQTFTISVSAVNDAPSFAKGPDQMVDEDTGPQVVAAWATAMSRGPANEADQSLAFVVTTTNDALFAVLPQIDSATGKLTYTPAPDGFGSATVTVQLKDNGGIANGGQDASLPQTFTITVLPVNDVPSFVSGPDQAVNEEAVTQILNGWATAVASGPANEASQAIAFIVTTNNDALFSELPTVDPATGTLRYKPARDAFGSALVTMRLRDDGGTDRGGDDLSDARTFTITVNAVNDVPAFTRGADQTVAEDAEPPVVAGWAKAISSGPANEAGQVLTFLVSTNNDALFASLPAIDPSTGTLRYAPAKDSSGAATVTVRLRDDSGINNGGVDTSAPQTFTITVLPVNDAPSFSKGPDQAILEDSGPQVVAGWAADFSPGPADESAQRLTVQVTTDNDGLFAVLPSVDPTSGILRYTPAANAFGSAEVTLRLTDDGGTQLGGTNTSAQTFTINIVPVNDAPRFTPGFSQQVDDRAGLQTIVGWATGVAPGPANETGQSLEFLVSTDKPALFAVAPTISPDGTLRYAPAPGSLGAATVSVQLQDDGGTEHGGTHASAIQTFTVVFTTVRSSPVADPGGPYDTLVGTTLFLDGSRSYHPDAAYGASIVGYQWDLGDDGQWDATGMSATVPWQNLASLPRETAIPVRLQVTDGDGRTHSKKTELVIGTDFPSAPLALGTVDFFLLESQDLSAADQWYELSTARAGLLTVEAQRQDVAIALFDSSFAPLANSALVGGRQRLDYQALAGQTFHVWVGGPDGSVDLRMGNLVRQTGTSVVIFGTPQDDQFAFDASAGRQVTINGLVYGYAAGQAGSFSFDGLGGADHVQSVGGGGAENAQFWPTSGTVSGPGYSLSLANIESTQFDGRGGEDTAWVWGSKGANTYTANPGSAEMTGDDVSILVTADRIYGRGGGGSDTATLWDSAGNDLFEFFPIWARVTGEGYFHNVQGFTTMIGKAELGVNGTDEVIFRGSPQGDLVRSTTVTTRMLTLGAWRNAEGFDTITAYSRGSKGSPDKLVVMDTPGADTLKLKPLETTLTTPDYKVTAYGFGTVEATRVNVNDSLDKVTLEGSAGNDLLEGNPFQAKITGDGPVYSNTVIGFPEVLAYSTGEGLDRAYFSDFTGPADATVRDDVFTAGSVVGELTGLGYRLWARLFDEVHAETRLGHDVANLTGTVNIDELNGTATEISLSGTNEKGTYANHAKGFDEVNAFAADGQDKAFLTDAVVDLTTYGPPVAISLEDLDQILWLNQFEKIEIQETASGTQSEIDGVDAVFAYWQ